VAKVGEVGARPKEVHAGQMRRKLASCSSCGRITFDVSLLKEQTEQRLEAILDELPHLRFPNRGKMFRLLLSARLRMQLSAHRGGSKAPGT
jgi:hypothetical protein